MSSHQIAHLLILYGMLLDATMVRMNTALLVIDMQDDCLQHPRLKERREALVTHINALTSYARDHRFPVIWARQEFEPNLSDAPRYNRIHNVRTTLAGTRGAQLIPELHTENHDLHVVKKRFSAFFKTNLEDRLAVRAVRTLIIAGVNTMSCVRVTAIDAYMRDYAVIIATDAVEGHDEYQHEASLAYLQHAVAKLCTNEEIYALAKTPEDECIYR
jgi:nicotinamidase-related amidase